MTTPSAPRTASSDFLLAVANFATSQGNWVSLHTADPQDTGAAEVSGGPYSRKQTAWSPAVMQDGEAVAHGADCTFNVPASTSCTYFGVWKTASGNDFLYGAVLTPPVNIGLGGAGLVIVSPRYGELPGPVAPALTLAGGPTAGSAAGTTGATGAAAGTGSGATGAGATGTGATGTTGPKAQVFDGGTGGATGPTRKSVDGGSP